MEETKSLLQLDTDLSGKEVTAIIDAMREGLNCYKLKIFLSPSCTDRSNCAYSIMKCLDNFSKTIKYNPDLLEIVEEKFGDQFEQIIVTALDKEKIREIIQSFKNISKVEITTLIYEEPVIDESKMLKKMELKDALNKIHWLTYQIQEVTSQLKTTSLKEIFKQLQAIGTDWAEISGKKVNLVVEDEDVEIDGALAAEIQECLIHLLKNAVDHGIESPQEREKLGKSQIGNVKITARKEAGKVTITVEDDGRGIDPERIKILTKNIDLSDEISGLIIVINKLNTFGGGLKVDSKLGKGSKFKLEIPLNLIMLKVLVVNFGEIEYAVPLLYISEIYKVKKNEIEDKDTLNIQGQILPILRFKNRFSQAKKDNFILLVVEKEAKKFAIIVNDIAGMQNAFIRYHKKKNGFSGIASLRNGRNLPILDICNIGPIKT
jgi:two-component system chemotaxis sensor kinase CheA